MSGLAYLQFVMPDTISGHYFVDNVRRIHCGPYIVDRTKWGDEVLRSASVDHGCLFHCFINTPKMYTIALHKSYSILDYRSVYPTTQDTNILPSATTFPHYVCEDKVMKSPRPGDKHQDNRTTTCVTPQDIIPTQDIIIAARCNTIYARCNKYAKCNNFYPRCNNTYQREM